MKTVYFLCAIIAIFIIYALADPLARAQDQSQAPDQTRGPAATGGHGQEKAGTPEKPEEEDYSSTPYTEYGEFNETQDEDDTMRFFQYGRLFGVSLGLGFQTVDGFRGALWQGGFPMVDLKLHYWFDFNVALDIGFFTAIHSFDSTSTTFLGHYDINLFHVGVNIKYYFPTTNLSSALSFANPYILAGTGAFSKTQTSNVQANPDTDTSMGLSAGMGLEFILSPRKTYFEIEGKIHIVNFKDTFSTAFSSMNIPNLTGNFYTISGNLLFTW